MSIFKTIFELFFLYMLYKLIFDFVLPIYETTKQVKKKVNEMQQHMNQPGNQQPSNQFTSTPKQAAPKAAKDEEYIDFEEVK